MLLDDPDSLRLCVCVFAIVVTVVVVGFGMLLRIVNEEDGWLIYNWQITAEPGGKVSEGITIQDIIGKYAPGFP